MHLCKFANNEPVLYPDRAVLVLYAVRAGRQEPEAEEGVRDGASSYSLIYVRNGAEYTAGPKGARV